MHLPLSGVRILSVEAYGAGPYGTMMLAQLGAEVIKIEPPGRGDSARDTGPHFLGPNDSLFFQTFNLNKRSLTLDLKSPAGQEVLHRLVATADAVTNNARGDQPAKLGIDYAALGPIRPAIVCVHASAYGRHNERAAWPGYDYLMQAEAGFLSVTGEPGQPPTRFGLSMVDYMTGQMLATATLAGLLDARATGKGRDYDISLFDAALHQTSYPATWYLNRGDVTGRAPRSAHPSVTPSQLFRTADGWLFVMAQLPKFWSRLVEALDAPQLAADPRFETVAARLANRDALTTELDRIFETAPTAHWIGLLGGICPVAPVNDIRQALENPFAITEGLIEPVPHPLEPSMRVLANPVRIDGRRLPARPAPARGADPEDLLTELGYSSGEIQRLTGNGTV